MKRILVVALAIVMVISTFTSCSTSSGAPQTNQTPIETPNQGPSSPETPEEDEVLGNLDPSIDLGQSEINIISRGHAYFKDEILVETNEGDPIENAIYQRRLDVERILNCNIVNWPVNETNDGDYTVCNNLKIAINGNDCPYDIMSASAYTAFGNTLSGLCHDLLSVENIDLDQKYWATHLNSEASIGNAQYFATGAISLSLRRFIWVTFFNKTLAESYGITDLYDVVNDGRWTLDYQAELITNMYSDLGNPETDLCGLVTNAHICTDPYWASCDVKVLEKNTETNFFELSPQTERIDNVLEKINDLYYKSGGAYVIAPQSGDADQELIRKKFTSGTATMATLRLLEVEAEDFRNMDSPYGILPMPKYEEGDGEYFSHAHDQFIVYGIVSSVPSTRVDDMGAFLECMAIEGYRTVTPAYYEVALKGKYSKDEESWQMLDDIVSNLKINGGFLYTMELNDLLQIMRNLIKNKEPSCVSKFTGRNLQILQIMLNDFQSKVEEIQ